MKEKKLQPEFIISFGVSTRNDENAGLFRN